MYMQKSIPRLFFLSSVMLCAYNVVYYCFSCIMQDYKLLLIIKTKIPDMMCTFNFLSYIYLAMHLSKHASTLIINGHTILCIGCVEVFANFTMLHTSTCILGYIEDNKKLS